MFLLAPAWLHHLFSSPAVGPNRQRQRQSNKRKELNTALLWGWRCGLHMPHGKSAAGRKTTERPGRKSRGSIWWNTAEIGCVGPGLGRVGPAVSVFYL